MNIESIAALATVVADLEDRTEELPPQLSEVTTWVGFVDAIAAEQFLARNVTPAKGVGGTNRPQVSGSIPALATDMINDGWKFSHQGIAFNEEGELIDGQHRLEAILLADKISPGISIPLMITWGLPLEANEKIDINRRRQPGTFLAMEGHASANRLSTTLKWVYLYGTADFDEPFDKAHWSRMLDVAGLRAALRNHPLAPEGVAIGGKFQSSGLLTASAAAAGWVICRERYDEEVVDEFVTGVMSGAELKAGDARLALRNWAINRKERQARADAPVHLAFFLKAFRAFRTGDPVTTLTFKPSVERFPRP